MVTLDHTAPVRPRTPAAVLSPYFTFALSARRRAT